MLELVERFEDLRVSDVVVVKPCNLCGNTHRGMLVERVRGSATIVSGPKPRDFVGTWFALAPMPSCCRHEYGIVDEDVAAKRFYRERIPPAETTEESTAQRPKVRELEDVGSRRGR